jgi:hypothetical protein
VYVSGGQGFAANAPVAAFDFLHHAPGDAAHGLAFYFHHGIGQFLNDLAFLFLAEYVLNDANLKSGAYVFSSWRSLIPPHNAFARH